MSYLPFLIVGTPLAIYAAWSDLTTMTIPNWITLALLAAFIPLGLLLLPFSVFLWHLGVAAVVLLIGFIFNALGLMGGGDAKLMTGFAPYIMFEDADMLLIVYCFAAFVTLLLHRGAKMIKPIVAATNHWKSWHAGRYFPMGISLAVTFVTYQILHITAPV